MPVDNEQVIRQAYKNRRRQDLEGARQPPPRRATRLAGHRRGRSRRRSTTTPLSVGFGRGFEVSAGIMLIALIITIAAVRVRARRPGRRPGRPGSPGSARPGTT